MRHLTLFVALILLGAIPMVGCTDQDTIFEDVQGAGTDTAPGSTDNSETPCTNPTWAAMATGYDARFNDVWGASKNNVYAVTGQGVLFHYDGTDWTVDDFRAGCSLKRIEGRSASDIYMGGHDDNCLFHFDGTAWSQVAAPPGGLYDMTLVDGGTIVTNRTPYGEVAYFNDGSGWRALDDERLAQEGIAALSMSDVYFLGMEMENCVDVPADDHTHIMCEEHGHVLHYDGSSVTSVRKTKDMFYDDIAVDRTSGRIFVTGIEYFHEEDRTEAFVGVSDNGVDFQISVLRSGQFVDKFEDIWVADKNNAFIVAREGVVFHFNGDGWTPLDANTDNPFEAIHGQSATDLFAVGLRGINHYGCDHGGTSQANDPGATCEWTQILGEDLGEFDAVWADGNGNPWLALSSGIGFMQSLDGETPFMLEEGERYESIDGADGIVFAAGQDSRILTCNADSCRDHTSPVAANFWGVYALEDTEAYLVGDNGRNQGVIVQYLDGALTEMPVTYSGRLKDVWAASSDLVIAVGESGVIMYDGTSWQTVVPNTNEEMGIFKVHGTAKDDIYVTVGTEYMETAADLGGVLHFDGNSWQELTIDDTVSFRDVYAAGRDDVFVSGTRIKEVEGSSEGVVYHFDGSTWHELNSCFDERIAGMHGNAGEVFALLPEEGLYRYTPNSDAAPGVATDTDDDPIALDSCEPMAQGYEIEYYASVGKGETMVVVRPEEDWSYEDFRVFYQSADGLQEKRVTSVTRYRDGGTTVITFMLNADLEVILTFPVHLDPDGEGGAVWDPATVEIDGTTLDVTRYEPAEFASGEYTFLCLG